MTFRLDVEIEVFISEVRKYPEIWDINCEDFRFKSKKQRAWAQIARLFVVGHDRMTVGERDNLYKKLNGKWRNIRDSYVRSIKKKDSRRYMYADHLTFLDEIYKGNDSQFEVPMAYPDEDGVEPKKQKLMFSDDIWQEDSASSAIDDGNRNRNLNFLDCTTTSNNNSNFQVEDADRSFFDSLLPAVREFNLDQKLEFRCEVINVLKNIRSRSKLKSEPVTEFD